MMSKKDFTEKERVILTIIGDTVSLDYFHRFIATMCPSITLKEAESILERLSRTALISHDGEYLNLRVELDSDVYDSPTLTALEAFDDEFLERK